ncbi:MAG: hypothetical protein MRY32_05825, partial [Rickettsiales bacterium]|nr:hypothetical protein [Rickettsiales bacterium]
MPIYAIEQNNTHYVLLYMHIPKTGGTSISQFMTGLGFTEYYGATDDVIKHVSRRPPAHFDYEICDTLFDLEKIT